MQLPVLVSSYKAPPLLTSGHLHTVVANFRRPAPEVVYRRERIPTPDGDFLDLDWSPLGSSSLVVICHGLEGNSRRAYVLGMVRAFNRAGWDALAWNFRGCGGQINRRLRFYHSGATDDLAAVVDHALGAGQYRRAALVGFSLGGNMVMKYLGEMGRGGHRAIVGGVGFSVPCDLASGAQRSELRQNRLYMHRFLKMLKAKVRAKMRIMPGALDDRDFGRIKSFRDFDERYTAPCHGFADAQDYWDKASARPWLKHIAVPALMVNAMDDPLLGPGCFPWREARENPCFNLETPRQGGHVGFLCAQGGGTCWSERRALEFLNSCPARKTRAGE
jgi:predicted alpha/beta-fold hydrolase